MDRTGNGPWIVAHRGAQAEAPENTHAAFEAAIRRGVDGIELDVQLTADKVPVIFHDNTLSRIVGIDRPVASFTLDEISQFDVGKWFSPAFAGEVIPTLASVIDRYAGKIALLVEIKSLPHWSDRIEPRREAALAVTRMIRRRVSDENMKHFFLLSFDPMILDMAHADAPGIRRVQNLYVSFDPDNIPPDENKDIFAYGLNADLLTPDFVKNIHALGRRVMVYSYNTATALNTAIRYGVDVILTDDPGATVKHFRPRCGS